MALDRCGVNLDESGFNVVGPHTMMTSALQPLDRATAREGVVKAMSQAVAAGEIPVGGFFPAERELAARLGVSRVVVREAAQALEEQGLVRIRHGIGVEVVNNSSLPVERTIVRLVPQDPERLRQCAEARLLVEPELAALAALAGSGAARRIRAAHESMKEISSLSSVVEADLEFHERIVEAAGNQVLALMLRSTASIGRRSREITLDKFGAAKAMRQHGEILKAIIARDPASARGAMRRHLQSALSDLDHSARP